MAPMTDRCLLVAIVLQAGLMAVGITTAADPNECDTLCRERRYHKDRDENGAFSCFMYKYRDCRVCTGAGKCSPNATTDDPSIYTSCEELEDFNNYIGGFPPSTTCSEMCAFPTTAGEASREAAEEASTYTSVSSFEVLPLGVHKCMDGNQAYRVWADEKDLPPKVTVR